MRIFDFFSLTATDKKEKFLNFDYSAWADIKLRFSLNRLHFWFCGNSDSVFDLLPRLEMKKKFSLFDTAFEHPTTKRLQFNVPIKSKVVATFNVISLWTTDARGEISGCRWIVSAIEVCLSSLSWKQVDPEVRTVCDNKKEKTQKPRQENIC